MKTIYILVLLFFLSFALHSQTSPAGSAENISTTTEEYNYLTKGYKIQLSSGLDMKQGYSFERLAIITKGRYKFDFQAFFRSESNQLAGIMIIANSEVSGRDYYLAMPIENSELRKRFEQDVRSWDESMTTAFAQALGELYSNNLSYYVSKI